MGENLSYLIFVTLIFVGRWSTTYGLNTNCNCWENVVFRKSCDMGGFLDEESCHRAQCCYDNSTSVFGSQTRPFCYKRKGKCPKDDQCVIPGQFREVCGHRAMDRPLCEMRGCCFDDSQYPFCYYQKRNTDIYTRTTEHVTTTTSISTSTSTTQLTTSPQPTSASTTTRPSPQSTSAPTTTRPTFNGGPFGFYKFGNIVLYMQCTNDHGISCGRNITDESNCNANYCCWNKNNTGTLNDPCFLPSIHLIKWPRLGTGSWTDWAPWENCVGDSCSMGIQLRNRTCTPAKKSSVATCAGNRTEERPCVVPCPPMWSSWSAWAPCPSTCGPGLTMRSRQCFLNGVATSGDLCPGRSYNAADVKSCNTDMCNSWTLWEESPCSTSCDAGVTFNSRACVGNRTKVSLTECSIKESRCNQGPCPTVPSVIPLWGPWSSWTGCSASCGRGVRRRMRSCFDSVSGDIFPPGGNIDCEGGMMKSRESEHCNTDFCSDWGNWFTALPCDRPCGEGLSLERRTCNNGSTEQLPSECSLRTVTCIVDLCR